MQNGRLPPVHRQPGHAVTAYGNIYLRREADRFYGWLIQIGQYKPLSDISLSAFKLADMHRYENFDFTE